MIIDNDRHPGCNDHESYTQKTINSFLKIEVNTKIYLLTEIQVVKGMTYRARY